MWQAGVYRLRGQHESLRGLLSRLVKPGGHVLPQPQLPQGMGFEHKFVVDRSSLHLQDFLGLPGEVWPMMSIVGIMHAMLWAALPKEPQM